MWRCLHLPMSANLLGSAGWRLGGVWCFMEYQLFHVTQRRQQRGPAPHFTTEKRSRLTLWWPHTHKKYGVCSHAFRRRRRRFNYSATKTIMFLCVCARVSALISIRHCEGTSTRRIHIVCVCACHPVGHRTVFTLCGNYYDSGAAGIKHAQKPRLRNARRVCVRDAPVINYVI